MTATPRPENLPPSAAQAVRAATVRNPPWRCVRASRGPATKATLIRLARAEAHRASRAQRAVPGGPHHRHDVAAAALAA